MRPAKKICGSSLRCNLKDDVPEQLRAWISPWQVDTCFLADQAAPTVALNEILRSQRLAVGQLDVDAGLVLCVTRHLGKLMVVDITDKTIAEYQTARLKEGAAPKTIAKAARSPAIYPALMLALNAGMRDAEIRGLQWQRLDLSSAILTVGESKTEAGEGRTIPLNSALLKTMIEHACWYEQRFGAIQPEWYVFAFGRPWPNDPTRPMVTLKT